MKIWSAPYRLQPRAALNSRTGSQERAGVLLRVETAHGDGFADLHPWIELGDDSLEAQIESLREGAPLALAARALTLAHEDAEARARKQSAFDGLSIPTSHFLVTDMSRFGLELVGAVEHNGFYSVKLKMGLPIERGIQALSRLSEDDENRVRLRLDFNSSLKPAELDLFIEALPSLVRDRIEFIEDPFVYESQVWAASQARLGLDFAADFETSSTERAAEIAKAKAAKYLVVKPTHQDDRTLAKTFLEASGGSVVVTSSMGHPLGQAAAAYHAGKLRAEFEEDIGVCGLLSHTAYFPNEYSEALRIQGPHFRAPEGTGLGFDDLLAREEWVRI